LHTLSLKGEADMNILVEDLAVLEAKVWDSFVSELQGRLNLTPRVLPNELAGAGYDAISEWTAIKLSEENGKEGTGITVFGMDGIFFEIRLLPSQRNSGVLRNCRDKVIEALLAAREKLIREYPLLERYFPTCIMQLSGVEYMWLNYLYDCSKWADITCEMAEGVYVEGIGHKMFLHGIPLEVRDPRIDDWDLTGRLMFWDDRRSSHLVFADIAVRADGETMSRQLKEELFGKISEPNYAKIRLEWTQRVSPRYNSQELSQTRFARDKLEGKICTSIGGIVYREAVQRLLL